MIARMTDLACLHDFGSRRNDGAQVVSRQIQLRDDFVFGYRIKESVSSLSADVVVFQINGLRHTNNSNVCVLT
jgi:hypothetical protein